jgi:hypothetical protein
MKSPGDFSIIIKVTPYRRVKEKKKESWRGDQLNDRPGA